MTKEFKMENIEENLLLDLHTRYPNTIDDNARLLAGKLGYEKGKAHGCIYSGKAQIINEIKGIELNFSIWFSVYCEAYGAPEIEPDVESYLTGNYKNIQSVSYDKPSLGLKFINLLNIKEQKHVFDPKPTDRKYFDAYWHVFETDNRNYVLSKNGWFDSWVYDKKLGMRPTNEKDWTNLGDGRRQIKTGLEIVQSFKIGEDPVRDFLRDMYYQKINPEMYVEL